MLGVAVLAPITAELLQAYLGDIGGPFGLIALVVFFAPLYGGAALLIREVAVRTGRGWPGRLLLATAFGVAMPTLVDASLFTVSRPDVDHWREIVTAASFAGIGWAAAVSWVAGHVLLSISAPLVLVENLTRRRGPWLGPIGLGVTTILMLLVAGYTHHEQVSSFDVRAGTGQYVVSAILVAVLVVAAMTPVGRPLRKVAGRSAAPPWLCVVIGAAVVAVFDVVPIPWLGLAIELAVLTAAGLLALRWSRSTGWGSRHVAGLAFGAVLARTVVGFLAAVPPGSTWTEKIVQNVLYLMLVLALGVVLERRTRADRSKNTGGTTR